MTPRRHSDALDGIRALAVWSVMLFHAGAPGFEGGWIGVDVFFVLSGFLITTLLLTEHGRNGKIALRRFWLRRALRLVPAYSVYVACVVGVLISTGPGTWIAGYDQVANYVLSLATYTVNYVQLWGIWRGQFLTGHLWSLAVEQQFYLIFPLVLILGVSWGKTAAAITSLLLLTVALNVWGNLPGNPNNVLSGRGISLLIGCLVAAGAFQKELSGEPSSSSLRYLHHLAIVTTICSALAIMGVSTFASWGERDSLFRLSPLLWVATAFAIAGYWYRWSSIATGLLSHPWICGAGRISYGVYLYHLAVWGLVFLYWLPGELPVLGRVTSYGLKLGLYFVLSHALAALSYRFIEQPFLRLKARASVSPSTSALIEKADQNR